MLNINLFPYYYIIDKNGNGIYYTDINFDKNITNSIYDKINSLKAKSN